MNRARDTRSPLILFVSRAEAEVLLRDHLAEQNVVVESGSGCEMSRNPSSGPTATSGSGVARRIWRD